MRVNYIFFSTIFEFSPFTTNEDNKPLKRVLLPTYPLFCCTNICISIKCSKTNYFATICPYINFMALKRV